MGTAYRSTNTVNTNLVIKIHQTLHTGQKANAGEKANKDDPPIKIIRRIGCDAPILMIISFL
jgi:hypothetical protein